MSADAGELHRQTIVALAKQQVSLVGAGMVPVEFKAKPLFEILLGPGAKSGRGIALRLLRRIEKKTPVVLNKINRHIPGIAGRFGVRTKLKGAFEFLAFRVQAEPAFIVAGKIEFQPLQIV